jgi:peptidoglycan/xylan/chitin deacetylase (PgdA/CDA1 family)
MSKKEFLTQCLEKTGVVYTLEKLPRQSQLIVLNYHRIGDASSSAFDPSVFSVDQEGFDKQIGFIKRTYNLVTPDDSLDIITGRAKPDGTCVAVTFDDGYRDCLELALPVLQSHNAKAMFFVVSQYAEHQPIPWWDLVAYAAKHAKGRIITLTYPTRIKIDLNAAEFSRGLKQLLDLYKHPDTKVPEEFMNALNAATGLPEKTNTDRLLLNWNEAKQMHLSGMEIGLHSNSHAVMSKLSGQAQRIDIETGRDLMRERLGFTPRVFAYPDGQTASFTAETGSIVKSLGFQAAFSFYGGCNSTPIHDPYNVLRTSFSPYGSMSRVRLSMALSAVTAKSVV